MRRYSIFVSIILLIVTLTSCMYPTRFDGNRTGNESEFLISYNVLNQEDYQLLELEEGDILVVTVVSESGKVNIEVEGDNEVIYTGKDVPTSEFRLGILESGTYKCSVAGKAAKGSVSFTKAIN